MPDKNWLINNILTIYPNYSFREGAICTWSATDQIITYRPLNSPVDTWDLLHEIAHAELKHIDYHFDVELIQQESEAWDYAVRVVGPRLGQSIENDHLEDSLDTYRLWLHERSRCPNCNQNGFQTTQNTYRCPNCRCSWRVNDARACALKRKKLVQFSP